MYLSKAYPQYLPHFYAPMCFNAINLCVRSSFFVRGYLADKVLCLVVLHNTDEPQEEATAIN